MAARRPATIVRAPMNAAGLLRPPGVGPELTVVRDDEPAVLELVDVTKAFPGQVALESVALTIRAGEIHALVGQNGSGKSTLIKLLSGFHQPDAVGSATFCGERFNLGEPRILHDAGVRFVHQELALVDSLSVLENFAMVAGYQRRGLRRIRWRDERARARRAFEQIGLTVDVDALAADLSAAERTDVALARATVSDEEPPRLLVLDEPTASLARGEVIRLFGTLRRLRDSGMAILFVSHHLEEVVELADAVTVLRDGRVVASRPLGSLDVDRLADLIVGTTATAAASRAVAHRVGAVRLRASDVVGATIDGFDVEVPAGAIVGLAGLDGSGRESAIGLLSGRLPRDGGTVEVDDVLVPSADPRRALKLGLCSVPNDRGRNGIIPTMDVRENMMVADPGRHVRRGWLSHTRERLEAEQWIEDLGVRATGSRAMISTLSGGNQQKVLLARAIRLTPSVLLLDEPTHGVDIGAKAEIHRLLDESAENGAAVLVASSDSEELARLCDTVLIFYRGRVVTEMVRGRCELTAEAIDRAQLAAS